MKPEEHIIDSLLHEHNRVSGETDEKFLKDLEAKLDHEAAANSIITSTATVSKNGNRIPTWIPIAAVATIVAILSLSIYSHRNKSSDSLAINDATTEPSARHNKPADATHTQPLNDAVAKRRQSAGRETSTTFDFKRDTLAQAESFPPKKTSADSLSDADLLQEPDRAKKMSALPPDLLSSCLATLTSKQGSALPPSAKKLDKNSKKKLLLAFSILQQQLLEDTETFATKDPPNIPQQVAALRIFQSVFSMPLKKRTRPAESKAQLASKPSPIKKPSTTSPKAKQANSAQLQNTLEAWKKDLLK